MTHPGFFTVIDGPSGVGKTTTARNLAERLTRIGHRAVFTCEPSSGPIGTLARTSTNDLRGLGLACLVAADRYHHLETEIRPALAAGYVVVCDRYLPTSLVLQHLDGVPSTFLWNLNAHADRPDLTILLTGDPHRCRARAIQRGTYSRFHSGIAGEADRYRALVDELTAAGTPPSPTTSPNRLPRKSPKRCNSSSSNISRARRHRSDRCPTTNRTRHDASGITARRNPTNTRVLQAATTAVRR